MLPTFINNCLRECNRLYSYVKLALGYSKVCFYNWLNLSYIEKESKGVYWIVYHHEGVRYRCPLIKKTRGPSFENESITEKYPEYANELRGPFGQYHGLADAILNS